MTRPSPTEYAYAVNKALEAEHSRLNVSPDHPDFLPVWAYRIVSNAVIAEYKRKMKEAEK